MAIIRKNVFICKCDRCGYEWQPRKPYKSKREIMLKVKLCPQCGSVRWNG